MIASAAATARLTVAGIELGADEDLGGLLGPQRRLGDVGEADRAAADRAAPSMVTPRRRRRSRSRRSCA